MNFNSNCVSTGASDTLTELILDMEVMSSTIWGKSYADYPWELGLLDWVNQVQVYSEKMLASMPIE